MTYLAVGLGCFVLGLFTNVLLISVSDKLSVLKKEPKYIIRTTRISKMFDFKHRDFAANFKFTLRIKKAILERIYDLVDVIER